MSMFRDIVDLKQELNRAKGKNETDDYIRGIEAAIKIVENNY